MELYWLAGAIVFTIIELMVPGLISVWFALGAGVTIFFSMVVESVLYQGYFFVILSGILLTVTRKFCKQTLAKRDGDVDRIIGQIVEIKGIDKNGNYTVYLDGKHWLGKSDEILSVGDKGVVTRIEGIKLVLDKTNEKTNVK